MSDVRIAELKARLAEYLLTVRNGGTLTVLDGETPIAQIVPIVASALAVRRARRHLRDLELPATPAKRTDSLGILIKDRRRR
jgi:antitoxin (DNA-binding transcriptional repressor) of toxin-antitoxin stability system